MSWVKDIWKEKPRREALRIGKIWLACYKFSAPRKARNRLFGDNQLHKQAGSAFWTSSVCSGSASGAPMRHKIKALHPWRGLQKGTSPIKKKTIMCGLSFSVNCRMQLWDRWEHWNGFVGVWRTLLEMSKLFNTAILKWKPWIFLVWNHKGVLVPFQRCQTRWTLCPWVMPDGWGHLGGRRGQMHSGPAIQRLSAHTTPWGGLVGEGLKLHYLSAAHPLLQRTSHRAWDQS